MKVPIKSPPHGLQLPKNLGNCDFFKNVYMCVSVLLLLFSFLFSKRDIFYSKVVKGTEIVQSIMHVNVEFGSILVN